MKQPKWTPGKWQCHDLTRTFTSRQELVDARRAQIVADNAIARMIFNVRYGYANNNR